MTEAPRPATGTVPFLDGETWYQIGGDPGSGRPPLLTLHGGPGSVHNYLLPLLDLIPDVCGHVFAGASHVAFSETPEEFRDVTAAFLAAHDCTGQVA